MGDQAARAKDPPMRVAAAAALIRNFFIDILLVYACPRFGDNHIISVLGEHHKSAVLVLC